MLTVPLTELTDPPWPPAWHYLLFRGDLFLSASVEAFDGTAYKEVLVKERRHTKEYGCSRCHGFLRLELDQWYPNMPQ
jgi:hypothetical protein